MWINSNVLRSLSSDIRTNCHLLKNRWVPSARLSEEMSQKTIMIFFASNNLSLFKIQSIDGLLQWKMKARVIGDMACYDREYGLEWGIFTTQSFFFGLRYLTSLEQCFCLMVFKKKTIFHRIGHYFFQPKEQISFLTNDILGLSVQGYNLSAFAWHIGSVVQVLNPKIEMFLR